MSQDNVEIVRAAIEAISSGEMDAALKGAAPDLEFDLSRAVGPTQHGIYSLDQVQRFWDEFSDFDGLLRMERRLKD